MVLSIRSKILTLLIGLALVAVGVATWLHISSSLTARRDEIQERAKDVGEFIGLLFKDQLLKDVGIPHDKRKLVSSWLANKPGIHFLSVYNSSGKKIFTNHSPGLVIPDSPRLNHSFIRQTLNSDAKYLARELADQRTYDFLVPVQLFEINFGLVRVGFDASRFYRNRNDIIQQNAVFGLLVIGGVILLGYVFTSLLVSPIKHLERVAKRFGEGDLSVRPDVDSGDEIQHLSEQFNTMAERIQQQIEDLRTIEELNRKISARLRPEKLYERIIQVIENTWTISNIALLLHDTVGEYYEIAAGLNVNPQLPDETDTLFGTLRKLADLTSQQPHHPEAIRNELTPILHDLFNHEGAGFSDALVFELDIADADDEVGYLVMASESNEFDTSQVNLLQTLTHQIKIAIQNARNYQRAVTDDLTGLYTRRFFEMELDREIDGARASDAPLSLAMIDIDNFKDYNDTYGHPEGDFVLRELAGAFRNQIRSSDIREASRTTDTLARYGGEEFVIILPETPLDGARKVSRRIVQEVASIEDFERQVTVSIGVAEFTDGESKQDFIKQADEALYRAKNEGKNRVVTAEPRQSA